MNKNDTETIVKDFLNLWQKQFAHISRDGDSARQGLDAFGKMQEAYANLMGTRTGNTKNAKSSATSDILSNIGNEFIRLGESYARLEERIAKLESGTTERRAAPAKKATVKKPARAAKRTSKTNK